MLRPAWTIVMMLAVSAVAVGQGRDEPSFAHPRDIGPRYEPDVERWWQDYRRTGCMPVPRAVRRPDGRYMVRTKRDCGGTPASRSGM